MLKQRLNIKTAASADGSVPFSDSEVSGHRSRPRDGRKSSSRYGGGEASTESPQRDSAGTWNRMQSGDRSSATAAASGSGRHTARSSSSSYKHDYQQRRSHGAERAYRRHGITAALIG